MVRQEIDTDRHLPAEGDIAIGNLFRFVLLNLQLPPVFMADGIGHGSCHSLSRHHTLLPDRTNPCRRVGIRKQERRSQILAYLCHANMECVLKELFV